MTATQTNASGLRIDLANVRKLDATLKPIHISELPEDQYQSFMAASERMLEARHMQMPKMPDLSYHQGYQDYAKVVVNGKVVAEINNFSHVVSGNQYAGIVNKAVNALEETGLYPMQGPELAQARAEKIAAALGGKVVKSASALTQSQFNAIPAPEQARANIDYEAMHNDPMFEQLQKTRQKRTAFLAQQLAQQAAQTTAA